MQPTLWDDPDPVAAAHARADGIAAADAHVSRQWRAAARDAIRWCAENYPDGFTSDEVLVRLVEVNAPYVHELAALGPQFMAAARAGEIAKTGAMRPTKFRRRHRDLTEWIGR